MLIHIHTCSIVGVICLSFDEVLGHRIRANTRVKMLIVCLCCVRKKQTELLAARMREKGGGSSLFHAGKLHLTL